MSARMSSWIYAPTVRFDAFYGMEQERMMTQDEVVVLPFRFADDVFRDLKRDEDAGDLSVSEGDLYAAVVPFFLQRQRSNVVQDVQEKLFLHSSSLLFSSVSALRRKRSAVCRSDGSLERQRFSVTTLMLTNSLSRNSIINGCSDSGISG